MNKTTIPLIFAIAAALTVRAGGLAIPDDVKAHIREAVDSGGAAAIVFGMVSPAGTAVFAHGAMAKGGPPVKADTLFEIGSITKTFTAILLMDAALEGKAALDDPIQKHLPAGARIAGFEGRPIRLRHLATHTGALPRMPGNIRYDDIQNPYAAYDADDLYAFLNQFEPAHEPGERFLYSNLGAGMLGHILTLIHGSDFDDLIRQRIAKPLGMRDTGLSLSEAQKARMAKGYSVFGQPAKNWDWLCLAGAGAIRSTVPDMLRYLQANIGLLDSPLAEAMRQTHQRQAAAGENVAIGLGWHVLERGERRLIWHNGRTGGFRSFCGFDPETKTGVVALTNSGRSMDQLGIHALIPEIPLPEAR